MFKQRRHLFKLNLDTIDNEVWWKVVSESFSRLTGAYIIGDETRMRQCQAAHKVELMGVLSEFSAVFVGHFYLDFETAFVWWYQSIFWISFWTSYMDV